MELGETMRKHRKGSDFGAGLDRTKSLMAEIEDKTVTLGRKTRTEVSYQDFFFLFLVSITLFIIRLPYDHP